MQGVKNRKQIIFGKTGSGKTVLARRLVGEADRVIFFDSNGHDYKDGVVVDGIEQLKMYWPRVIDSPFRIVYRSIKPRADFPVICDMVRACGNLVFVIDEVHMYFDDGEPSEEFADLIRRGRHSAVDLVGITQRPRQMGEIRSMASELFIFDTHEPSDLQYYKQSFSPALVDAVRSLKEFEYVRVEMPYDENKLEICKEVMPGYGTEKREVCESPADSNDAVSVTENSPPDSESSEDSET